jgi:MOSC domain-containing protein YiiM
MSATPTVTGTIIAVCWSKKKGTRKTPISEGVIEVNQGLRDDAHADCTSHRQVSLLSTSSIEKMRKLGLNVGPGDFAENLTIDGLDVFDIPVGTRVSAGDAVLMEITQIGKECHTKCAIYHQVGQCAMPEEGVFARVLQGGVVKPGDALKILSDHEQNQSSRTDAGLQA